MNDKRILNEIKHGKIISQKGESVWGWSSAAGQIRWQRRCDMFKNFIGNNFLNVLEIGCGSGLFTKELAKTKNFITSIDISGELINIAKQRLKSNHVNFVIENAYKTSFEDECFDFIIGSSVLHHLELDLALEEMNRLLNKNGKIMFTEPNMLNPQIMVQKNIPFVKKLAGDSPDETAFFKWYIKDKLIEHKFKVLMVEPFDFLHPAIPSGFIPFVKPFTDFMENMPLVKEIAGSLLIQAQKDDLIPVPA